MYESPYLSSYFRSYKNDLHEEESNHREEESTDRETTIGAYYSEQITHPK